MPRLIVFSLGALVAVVAFSLANVAVAEDKHEGTVVSTSAGKLVMTDKDGNEHSHDVGAKAKITLDGKAAKLTDLKKGQKVTVTTDDDGKVTAIAAKSKA